MIAANSVSNLVCLPGRKAIIDSRVNFVLAVILTILLFRYGLQAFTREVQDIGRNTLKNWLGRLTRDSVQSVVLSPPVIAIVHSSSAAVALAISRRFRNPYSSADPACCPGRQHWDNVKVF